MLPWKRNIFIDGGGNNGCSVRKFRKELDSYERFHIFTFEPNSIYANNYINLTRHTLIPAILHNRDGYTEFFLDREDGDGSTIFKDKLTSENGGYGTLDTAAPESIKTVDLSRWIQQNTVLSDFIALKLDVEGAEYDILEKMHVDKTLSRIKVLYIEWHWQKVGIPKERHDSVVNFLNQIKIPIVDWDAQGY